MKYWDEMGILNSAEEKGKNIGMEKAGQIMKALLQGDLSIDQIAKKFSVTLEYINNLKDILGLTP